MLKLLIAVDGSDHSRRAIEAAGRLAKLVPQTEAVLLCVGEGVVYYGELMPLDYDALERARRQHQQTILDEALAHARACGLQQATTLAADGPAASEIARIAAERGVDQIVLGTQGKGALGSFFLGSVAQSVVHQATMPVLLVK